MFDNIFALAIKYILTIRITILQNINTRLPLAIVALNI